MGIPVPSTFQLEVHRMFSAVVIKTILLLRKSVGLRAHLGCELCVGAEHRLQSLGLLEELGHGPVVLPHVLLGLLLLVEQCGQVVPEAQIHLEAPQATVKPGTHQHTQ